jgi:hypothetical protein
MGINRAEGMRSEEEHRRRAEKIHSSKGRKLRKSKEQGTKV